MVHFKGKYKIRYCYSKSNYIFKLSYFDRHCKVKKYMYAYLVDKAE